MAGTDGLLNTGGEILQRNRSSRYHSAALIRDPSAKRAHQHHILGGHQRAVRQQDWNQANCHAIRKRARSLAGPRDRFFSQADSKERLPPTPPDAELINPLRFSPHRPPRILGKEAHILFLCCSTDAGHTAPNEIPNRPVAMIAFDQQSSRTFSGGLSACVLSISRAKTMIP